MLPDYPKTKKLFNEVFLEKVALVRDLYMGELNQIRKTRIHEGSLTIFEREDGSSQEMSPQQREVKGQLKLDPKNLANVSREDMESFIHQLGKDLAIQMKNVVFETLNQELTKAGQVSTEGLSQIDKIFEMYEKCSFNFDANGFPIMPQLYAGSIETREVIRELFNQIISRNDLSERFIDIMNRKRNSYYDREASRKLVDACK